MATQGMQPAFTIDRLNNLFQRYQVHPAGPLGHESLCCATIGIHFIAAA